MKVLLLLFSSVCSMAWAQPQIYNSDSTLTSQFVASLCDAVKNYREPVKIPLQLEVLINSAAGTSYREEGQNQKIYMWWTRHYEELYCKVKKIDMLHLSRLIIEYDVREISNELGPHGRLSIDVEIKDSKDSLTLREYAKHQREIIQERYKNQSLRFQKNKRWKNYTFYMLLFTEYEVQWAVLRDEQKKN